MTAAEYRASYNLTDTDGIREQMLNLREGQIVKVTTRGSRRSITRYGEVLRVQRYGATGVLVSLQQSKPHAEYGFVTLNRRMNVTAFETSALEVQR